MAYRLVIVESPAKCKKIESYLGSGYKCVASFGHIRELDTKKGLKCIDIDNNFSPKFIESYSKKQQISKLRSLVHSCSEVILATDDDREGEAIAWHLCKVLGLSLASTKRIIFHEITKTALQKAVANPTRVDMDKVNAQLARQVLDLLVGFTISPLLWKHITKFKKASLSAGRCQTPALRLIYDNQKEIDANPGKEGYDITGLFTKLKLPFKLNTMIESKETTEEFLEESVNHDHMLTNQPVKQTTKKAPEPLTTSSLQQKASNVCNYSPKQTMAMCQTLYEAGYITYMRTDSKTYSKEFLTKASDFIENKYGSEYVKQNLDILSNNTEKFEETKTKTTKTKVKQGKKSDNNAQEAHEAIRPTDITRMVIDETKKITKREIKLYNLIWSHSVESCMEDAKYKTLKSMISAPMEHHYKYTSEQVVFPGWQIVNGYNKESPEFDYMKKVTKKKPLKYHKISASYSLFELKQHFTEAKLVSLLEKKGIGRPSTFSALISKIQEREYVKKADVKGKTIQCVDYELVGDEIEELEHTKIVGNERNKMVITPTGSVVIEFLIKYFNQLFNYDYTKSMEDVLDVIACGKRVWHTLCNDCNTQMREILSTIDEELQENYEIDENHTYTIGRYGPVIKTKVDGKTKFLKVKPEITLDMIKKGILSIHDIIDTTQSSSAAKQLGSYKGTDVVVKEGKFGLYATIDGKNYGLKHLGKTKDAITLQDVISVIENKSSSNKSIVRSLNEDLSIRNGKYGEYIFYKTKKMTKPKFLKLKGFTEDPHTCDANTLVQWVQNTYLYV